MKRRGFTLIELLVVVLIIGILAAVALPQYQKTVEKARASEAVLMIRDLTQAVDRWLLANGGMPAGYVALEDSLDIKLSQRTTGEAYSNLGKFSWSAQCDNEGCAVAAHRDDNGGHAHYSLWGQRSAGSSTWTKTCAYSDDIGEKVCRGLVSDGYVGQDDRPSGDDITGK